MRATSRAIVLFAIAFVVIAPIAWERLPEFGLVYIDRPRAPSPEAPKYPGVDDAAANIPRLIRPTETIGSSSGVFTYSDSFGGRRPFVTTCEPVGFVIRRDAAPENGAQLIVDAVQVAANRTGLTFKFNGFTSQPYKFNQRRVRYAWEDERSDLWIGWATDSEVPALGAKSDQGPYAIGVGGPIISSRGGRSEIIGGGVVLRSGEALSIQLGPGRTAGNVLFHELGHAFGLDHVRSIAELMFPALSPSAPNGYGPGDRQGLAELETGCSP